MQWQKGAERCLGFKFYNLTHERMRKHLSLLSLLLLVLVVVVVVAVVAIF